MELELYLKENDINYIRNGDLYTIDNVVYHYIKSDDNLPIINQSNEFTVEASKDDVIFEFGGKYYYSKFYKFELNQLLYLGKAKSGKTKSFLGVHGGYEILSGSREYKDWVKKAKFLGVEALGINERNTLAGVIKFNNACNKENIKSIIGMELLMYDTDKPYSVNIYVKNKKGWENLLKINNIVNLDRKNPVYSDIENLTDGLFFIYNPNTISYSDYIEIDKLSNKYSIGVEYNNKNILGYLENLKQFVENRSLEPIALTNAYYLESNDVELRQTLLDISGNAGKIHTRKQHFNSDKELSNLLYLLSSEDELYIDSILGREDIVTSCDFEFDFSRRYLPKYNMTKEESETYSNSKEMLLDLISKGMDKKVPKELHKEYWERVYTELEVIEYGNVIDYFLILWDIIKVEKEKGYLVGFGRGSSSGSIISYLLNITNVNPIDFGLLFSRFLTKGRVSKSLPDIDCDFQSGRRTAVHEYMKQKYGDEQFAIIGTYGQLKPKSLIKDLGRFEGLEFKDVNKVTFDMSGNLKTFQDVIEESQTLSQLKKFIKKYPKIANSIPMLTLQPKSESQHPCATLLLPKDKTAKEFIPLKIMNVDGVDLVVTQWEGGEIEQAGFLKEDILGITQLDKYSDMLMRIKTDLNKDVDIYSVPLDDNRVYEYFRNGWNSDIFHLGSVGLTQYCIDMQPETINDLIAALSLYRPGSMENNYHIDYIKLKNGEKEPKYLPLMEEATKETYGLIVYQEQVMAAVKHIGGFDDETSDLARSAMGKKKIDILNKLENQFKTYATTINHISSDQVNDIWGGLLHSAEYQFNKSHAAAYAITAYVGEWLKVYYPLQFWATTFSFADDGKYSRFLSEIHNSGEIKIKPVDINFSKNMVVSNLKTNSLYWSLNSVRQCGEKAYSQIIESFDISGEYLSFDNFLSRHIYKDSRVNKGVIENLILSGAFDRIEEMDDITNRGELIQYLWEYIKDKKSLAGENKKINLSTLNNFGFERMQKYICGFNSVDWSVYYDNLNSYSEFLNMVEHQYINVVGFVSEFEIKKTKGGKSYIKLKLDYNYNLIDVMIWSDALFNNNSLFDMEVNDILYISAEVSYNDYAGKNTISCNKMSTLSLNGE